VSHQPERKEKNCLNCGALVQGRFCHVCGQENIVTKENFFSLVKHFVYDILHFDSKFFDTLRYLLFRPGYLSKQYVAGKRVSFLNPIRMYLFTSALFFLVLFSINDPKTSFINFDNINDTLSRGDRIEMATELREALAQSPDNALLQKKLRLVEDTTKPVKAAAVGIENGEDLFIFRDSVFNSLQQYDSVQKSLQPQKRDNWVTRQFIRRGLAINAKYSDNPKEGIQHFTELFVHRLPYMLFLSLPFFALILKLLYIRRKDFYYSDHAIFTLHHYIFSFIILLLVFLLSNLNDWLHVKLFGILITLLFISWPVYLYAALKKFYGQGWGKTFSKFLLLNLLGFLVLLLLFIIFIFFTFFQI
jgi:hypothetical protein